MAQFYRSRGLCAGAHRLGSTAL